ncbi:MAG: hypothetical protein ACXIT4_05090 [Erythrobacter sp.]
MAQVKKGPWSFSNPALTYDPMRQRVQFNQKALRQGWGQAGHNAHREHIPPHVRRLLIRGDGKQAASSRCLDQKERKAPAQPAQAKPALSDVGQPQPAFNPESMKQPLQRMRTALNLKGEGFVSLRHERKSLKASSCEHAVGENEERNIA